jgi:hypothetical protein
MKKIGLEDLRNIAVGASVLGAGGGGDPYIGRLMASQAIEEYGPITLLDPLEVPDDALIIPSAMMGSPTVLVEKIPNGKEIIGAFRALEKHLGKKAYATMAAEEGGINSMVPLMVAATLGIPIVDCDGMGRAFPEIQMVTMTIGGISATPMSIADEKGNILLLETIDNLWTEKFSRSITVDMGGSAMIALYPMSGAQLKKWTVHGSVSQAEKIGLAIRSARKQKRNPIEAVLKEVRGFILFKGKIVDVYRRVVKGFARGRTIIDGFDEFEGKRLTIEFQNENLVAIDEVRGVIASVPDLICILEMETGEPITTEGLKYGYRVYVLGLPCPELWRTPEGLKLVGPKYFGYNVEYKPIEKIYGGELEK